MTNPAHSDETSAWKLLPALSALCALALFAVSANLVFGSIVRVSMDFAVRPELFAKVATVQFSGFFLSSIAGGILADRYGRKRIIQSACLILAGGAWIWGGSDSVSMCYLGSFLLGIGGGILESLSCVILIDLFPNRKKLVLNISQVCYCLGAVGSLFLLGWYMPSGISWRLFFFVMSILSVGLFAMFSASRFPVFAIVPEQKERHANGTLRSLLRRWTFIAPCIGIFCYVLAETGAATFINVYLQGHYHAPPRWAILAIALFWLFMVLGRMICAFLPETVSPKAIIVVLSFVAASLFPLQVFLSSWQASIACFALLGFACAGIWPLIINVTTLLNPRSSGTVVGITVAVGSVGCILAPVVMGYLFNTLYMPLAWCFAAIPMALCGVVIGTVPGRRFR